jgi:hypothetical protein
MEVFMIWEATMCVILGYYQYKVSPRSTSTPSTTRFQKIGAFCHPRNSGPASYSIGAPLGHLRRSEVCWRKWPSCSDWRVTMVSNLHTICWSTYQLVIGHASIGWLVNPGGFTRGSKWVRMCNRKIGWKWVCLDMGLDTHRVSCLGIWTSLELSISVSCLGIWKSLELSIRGSFSALVVLKRVPK